MCCCRCCNCSFCGYCGCVVIVVVDDDPVVIVVVFVVVFIVDVIVVIAERVVVVNVVHLNLKCNYRVAVTKKQRLNDIIHFYFSFIPNSVWECQLLDRADAE